MSPAAPKPPHPHDGELASSLGEAKALWDELLERIAGAYDLGREWKYYGAKYGWQLKLTRGRRAALYMIPKHGFFVAALALDEAAVHALHARAFAPALVLQIEGAKRAPEGRPARVDVREHADLEVVLRLIDLKLAR